MYSADSRTRGLTRAVCRQRTKYSSCKYFLCESVSPRVRSPQNTLGPPIQSNDQTIQSVPSSSGRLGSTLSGGAAHHKFCACFVPPTLYGCARLCSGPQPEASYTHSTKHQQHSVETSFTCWEVLIRVTKDQSQYSPAHWLPSSSLADHSLWKHD